MKILFLAILLSNFLFSYTLQASAPVERTLTGCVFDNKFYSVKSDRAYPIHFYPEVNLASYNGKTIKVMGWLYPGDRFSIKEGTHPQTISNICEAGYRKAINRLYINQFQISAIKTAKQGNFTEALMFINNAIEMDRTDCNSYIYRAQIYCLKDDFDAASKDISIIKERKCKNPKQANHLFLLDLGKILAAKSRKQEALEVYELAIETCSADDKECIETIKKDFSSIMNK